MGGKKIDMLNLSNHLGFSCLESCWTPIDDRQFKIKDEGSNMRSNKRSKL